MSKKKILIVEDEESLAKIMEEKFISEGFEVSVANNGLDGLQAAEQYNPDLILLDVIMPIMDGITMLEKMRRTPWGKDKDVIMLTNLSDSTKVSTAIGQGAYDYLIKSDWKLEDLVKKIRERFAR